MTSKEYRQLVENTRRLSKYRAKPVIYDGIRFSSTKEGNRYLELKDLVKSKLITQLQLQVPFILQVGFKDRTGITHRPITYVCDFYYYDNQRNLFVVEDCKGYKTDVYKLKKKLLIYNIIDKLENTIFIET